jgi:hypothetical protein
MSQLFSITTLTLGRAGATLTAKGRALPILRALALGLLLVGCGQRVRADQDVTCAKVDSRLIQLMQAPNRDQLARTIGLDYAAGTVLVVVEVRGGAEPPKLDGFQLSARNANLLEGRIAPDALCRFASQEQVIRVSAPVQPVPYSPAGRQREGLGEGLSRGQARRVSIRGRSRDLSCGGSGRVRRRGADVDDVAEHKSTIWGSTCQRK